MTYSAARDLFERLKELPVEDINVYGLMKIAGIFTKKIDDLLEAADDAYYERLERD